MLFNFRNNVLNHGDAICELNPIESMCKNTDDIGKQVGQNPNMFEFVKIRDDATPLIRKIADAMNEREVSMNFLSKHIGRSPTYLRDLFKRNGEPKATDLEAIFEYLGLEKGTAEIAAEARIDLALMEKAVVDVMVEMIKTESVKFSPELSMSEVTGAIVHKYRDLRKEKPDTNNYAGRLVNANPQ